MLLIIKTKVIIINTEKVAEWLSGSMKTWVEQKNKINKNSAINIKNESNNNKIKQSNDNKTEKRPEWLWGSIKTWRRAKK